MRFHDGHGKHEVFGYMANIIVNKTCNVPKEWQKWFKKFIHSLPTIN